MAVMLVYLVALVFYMWVRTTKTLDLGKFLAYGIIVLVVEIMGASATLLYGLNIIFHPVNAPVPEDPANPGLPKVCYPFPLLCVTICCFTCEVGSARRICLVGCPLHLSLLFNGTARPSS